MNNETIKTHKQMTTTGAGPTTNLHERIPVSDWSHGSTMKQGEALTAPHF